MSDWRTWPRSQQCLLYVVGILDDLRARGFIRGGHNLTAGGRQAFEQMQAEGFKVSEEERTRAVRSLLTDSRPDSVKTPPA